MSKEIENEDGTTEVVYTADEYNAQTNNLTARETELEEIKRVNAERGQNFTALSKMSEEEKKTYDANTLNLLKREEVLVNELAGLKTALELKETNEKSVFKNNALNNIHGNDEATKKAIEEKYALLSGMPETTQDEINARAKAAATLAGIQVDPRNPLYSPVSGDAPNYKENKEFTESPEGKEAAGMVAAAMNIKTN